MRARDNPFAASRLDGLAYRFLDPFHDAEALVVRLGHLDFRGAIIGREGRGKSTLLGEIGEQLAARMTVHRWVLRRGETAIPGELLRVLDNGTSGEALLLDGAEQLSPIWWMRIRRASRSLGAFVITSHREGLLPTLFRCESSPELLESLLDILHPRRSPPFPEARELFERHRGDLRQALFDAYDFCARTATE